MNEPTPPGPSGSRSQTPPHSASQATLDVVEVLKRQFWLIASCAALGMLLAVVYWANAREWYETRARMLVTLKDPRLADPGKTAYGEEHVEDNALANHIEIVRSQNIIEKALARGNLAELPSIKEHLKDDVDAMDYVADQLVITKGGEGMARDARTLNIAFRHTDRDDALKVLEAVVLEYEAFLDQEVQDTMSIANNLIDDDLKQVDDELKLAQERYIQLRASAPLLYTGEGGSSIYQDKVRRLYDELETVKIKYVAVSTRLEKVQQTLISLDRIHGTDLEKLALIDQDSLQRLVAFATIQATASSSADFQAYQPQRLQEATTEMQTVLQMKIKRQQLESAFGAGHPEMENLDRQIEIAEREIAASRKKTAPSLAFEQLNPQTLLNAYLGFLKNDLAALEDQQTELEALAAVAEQEASQMVAYELQEELLKTEIERKQTTFDSIIDQVRSLNTVTGLSGFGHHVLESPQAGERVWPDLKICVLAGSMVGLVFGILFGIFNDQIDKRFRTPAEIDATTGVPVIGQVGRIRKARGSKRAGRMIVDAQAPEAESFRLLRTYLLRDVKSGTLRLISATSCQTKDGKSTILCNLAASFSELGIRTVIVDGDMRAPTTHRFFDISVNGGLSELLQGQIKLDEAIKPSGIEGLSLITAGAAVRNPAELLDSEQFDTLTEQLKERFDLIMIDSGPVLWVSDPAIVSQRCDATLMIIRSSTDTKRKVQESVRRLRAANANIRGCIINTYGSTREFTQDTGYSSPYHYYYYGGYGRRAKELGSEDSSHKAQTPGSGIHSHGTHGPGSHHSHLAMRKSASKQQPPGAPGPGSPA